MSTRFADKPRCVHCGVRDTYSANRLEYRTISSDVPELVCHNCAEKIKHERFNRKIKNSEGTCKKQAQESETYKEFIERHILKIERYDLLPDKFKTEDILSFERELEQQKQAFYGILDKYKTLANQVSHLHLNRIQELNMRQ